MPKKPAADLPALAERLIEIRRRLDLNQKDFADRLSVSWRALQSYEQGKSIPGGQVLAEYAALGVDVFWLLTGEKFGSHPSEPASIGHGSRWEGPGGHEEASHGGLIPVYEMAEREQTTSPLMMLNMEMLSRLFHEAKVHSTLPSDSLAAMKMPDDSMEPTLTNGSLVLVDRSFDRPASNGLYALDLNGQKVIRRIQVCHNKSILLRCDNPNWQTELIHLADDCERLIVGRALLAFNSWAGLPTPAKTE